MKIKCDALIKFVNNQCCCCCVAAAEYCCWPSASIFDLNWADFVGLLADFLQQFSIKDQFCCRQSGRFVFVF